MCYYELYRVLLGRLRVLAVEIKRRVTAIRFQAVWVRFGIPHLHFQVALVWRILAYEAESGEKEETEGDSDGRKAFVHTWMSQYLRLRVEVSQSVDSKKL
jgi:hypothetical protein